MLLKQDPKLTELASSDSGPLAQGLLFGNPFLKDLSNFVAVYINLNKA